jgi:molybdate transport system substrate-binding protein
MAQTLKVFTTVALKGVLEALAPDVRRSHGLDIAMTIGPAGVVLKRVRAGEQHDVLVVTPDVAERMESEGLARAGSSRKIASSVVGVAVRAGAQRPAIATPDELKACLLAAKTVAYTDPSTGAASAVHFMTILEGFGIVDQIKAKAVLGDGGAVAEFVADGRAEIAIQQLSEHCLVKGVDVVGPIPDSLQKVTVFSAAVAAGSQQPEPAAALIALLCEPRVQAGLAKHGLTPEA